ncbi:hypothetical protein MN116_005221 [Schistosoma mekongi]|uniref:Transmembrane protein 59 n=1 Tax=Schistosoma mekongi TaxID=38744 RepID=A0AAE1ZE65_SCHME|nr:hypothetical protein MN116_005221 [Schistosoma mekongi]
MNILVALLLVFSYSLVGAEEFPLTPETCQEICISKFDGAEEDACSRGCILSNLNSVPRTFTCEESCEDVYKLNNKSVAACKVGCGATTGHTSISLGFLPVENFFGSFFDKVRQILGGVNSGPEVSLNPTMKKVDSDSDSDARNNVVISRIRIFHVFDPLDARETPLRSLGEMIPQDGDTYSKFPKNNGRNIIRIHSINDEGESTFSEHQPTLVGKVTYFFRHIMFRPLLLPLLIALLIVILLLMVKLTIHACRVREHRHIEYTRLPTYIEAMGVKVPLHEDVMKCEKSCEKAPIGA